MRRAIKLLEICRHQLGDEVDMHERLSPNEAVQFCKEAEPLRMFFLEDPLSPEDLGFAALAAGQLVDGHAGLAALDAASIADGDGGAGRGCEGEVELG
jgi:L-alanine-DL-glutamate epimerase-like enolase superfamily enzyme